jgi:EmrB/QacA subfamily drug resistance transporter
MSTTVHPTTPHVERSSWLALVVIMGATIMVALDTTIVNVALHQIGVGIGAEEGIEWVVTAYLLAVCVSQPATGWLADRLGRRPVFLASLAAFTGASVLCAMAPSLGFLVGARVLQGLGGGALMPVGMAMVLDLFPRQMHGRTVAIWGMAAMMAPAIGPTLGGWLVDAVSWHWLFLINAPIGIVTFIAGLRLLPDVGHRERRPFDTLGLVLGSGGLTIAILGLSQANDWGWASPTTLACILGGVGALFFFVRHELHSPNPMIEMRMFSNQPFRVAMGVLLFLYVAQFGRLVFLPLQLEGLRGESAVAVGLLFLPAGIVTAIFMSIGGKLVDGRGPRFPVMVGCVCMFIAMFGFARLTLTTPMALIAVFMCIQGAGLGITVAPAMIAGLSDLPANLTAQGTALRSLLGQSAGAVAIAVLGAVVAFTAGTDPTSQQTQHAYNTAFAVAAVGTLIALLLARRLPDRVEVTEALADVEADADLLLAVE